MIFTIHSDIEKKRFEKKPELFYYIIENCSIDQLLINTLEIILNGQLKLYEFSGGLLFFT